jgi:hypothetical protein
LPPGYCGEAATAIFKAFLETRLTPPDGTLAHEAEHEIGETEEADRCGTGTRWARWAPWGGSASPLPSPSSRGKYLFGQLSFLISH